VTVKQFAVLPSGAGGYLLTSQNQVVAVGQATVYGQAPAGTVVSSIAVDPAGTGYWLLTNTSQILNFGSAPAWTPPAPPSNPPQPPTVANGSFVRVAGTDPVYWYENGTLYHVPNPSVFFALGGQWSDVQALSELPVGPIGLPLDLPFPDGTLVRPGGGDPIYMVWNGVLRHIASPTVFDDLGLSWSQVVTVPPIQPTWPVGEPITTASGFSWPNGVLVQTPYSPRVYLVDNGTLRWIVSEQVFFALGFQFSRVMHLSHLPPLPIGTPIYGPGDIPYATGTLIRLGSTAPVYDVQNGVLRWIPTEALFNAMGFNLANVLSASSLAGIPTGPNVDAVATSIPATPPWTPLYPVALIPNDNGAGAWVVWNTGTIQAEGGAPTLPQPALAAGTLVTGVAATPNDRGLLLETSAGVVPVGTVQTWAMPGTGVQLAIAPVAAPDEVSAAYGFFVASEPNGPNKSSYQDLLNDGSQLSLIQPAWFNPSFDPTTNAWVVGTWTTASNIQQVVNQAHSEHVLVLPSIGLYYTPSTTLSQDPMALNVSAFVNQIVQLTQQYNLDGITIDFENNGIGPNMTQETASQQYSSFIQQLGAALHAAGKRLIIAVYASPYPDSIYDDATLQNYVDWINVMTYPEHNSATPPGPTAGLQWQEYWIHQILATGVDPGKILMGVAPYGHSWFMSPTAGIQPVYGTSQNHYYSSDRSIEQMVQQDNIKTYWDPYQAEMFFTTGSLATAPQPPSGGTYNTNDVNTFYAPVQDLQELLNIVNDIHAIQSGVSLANWPVFLWADGYYGSYTAEAVSTFQSWAGLPVTGTYNSQTATALQTYINQYNVGSTIWWDDTPESLQQRLNYAIAMHLAGVDAWRLPFEEVGYFNVLANTSAVNKY
jgi:spore germination protein YaaH